MLSLVLVSAALLSAEAPKSPDAEPADTRKVKVLASTNVWQLFAEGNKGPLGKVISTGGELALAMGKPVSKEKEALEQAARAFKVKGIDLSKQMILVVGAGSKPSGGYSVTIKSVTASKGKLLVAWKVDAPAPGSFTIAVITYPGQALLVEKTAGKVEFDPPLKNAR